MSHLLLNMKLTPSQLVVLHRASRDGGTGLRFERQTGRIADVYFLKTHELIEISNGRVTATAEGLAIVAASGSAKEQSR